MKLNKKPIVTRTLEEGYLHWIKALRSGKYKQTNGTLKESYINGKPSFCCLGVVCDLLQKDGCNARYDADTFEVINDKGELESNSAMLPEFIRKNLKLTEAQQSLLADMNDEGKSFAEIADYIEKKIMPVALKKSFVK